MRPTLHALAIATLVLVIARDAYAEPQPRIVVISDGAAQSAVPRLRAELEALGFVVVVADTDAAAAGHAGLEAAARQEDAVAALRIIASRAGVEVWVSDRVTGKTLLREVVLAPDGDEMEAIVALRAIELLRASLLEIHVRSRGPSSSDAGDARALETRSSPALPAAVTRLAGATSDLGASWPEPGSGRATVGVALAGITATGGVGAVGQLRLGVDVRWTRHATLGAAVAVPILASTVSDTEGSADVGVGFAGLHAGVLVDQPRWHAAADGGLAVTWVHLQGFARVPFTSQSDTLFVASAYARARGALRVGSRVRVEATLMGGANAPRVAVTFADRTVARWGRWFASASLGVTLSID